MKKLISAKDIELAQEQGKSVIFIDSNTIITPLAEDAARINNIEISIRKTPKNESLQDGNLDMDMIYKVVQKLKDKGLLAEMMELISGKPYEYEEDDSGLKLIKGSTIRFKSIKNKDLKERVLYRQLISNKQSNINNGLLSIDDCEYTWHTEYEEVYYIIDGDIRIRINNNTFIGYAGDVLYIPTGSKITISSSDKAKLFYTTYLE